MQGRNTRKTAAWLTAAMLTGGAAVAAEPSRTGTLLLTLESGLSPRTPEEYESRDIEVELTLRDGKFEKKVWGYAVSFNRADHEGEVVAADGDKLTVKLSINKDKWFPLEPGSAEYQMTIQREGDAYNGIYIGAIQYTGKDGQVKHGLKGKVTGKLYPLWTEPPAGFRKLEPKEHPRLIFRRSDLPMIKKRLETPEGKAILARMLEALPKQHAKHNKTQPYFAAGYAMAYQITGNKAHAEKAKEILSGMMDIGGSQDIHWAPIAQSMAVTLDLCYDTWNAEFRQQVIDNLAKRTVNLSKGEGIGTFAPNPWHNHNGVRAPSTGVAAICLLGEMTSDGKEALPDAERMIHLIARDTRRYFQYNGIANTGWCLEGGGYKRMTWNSGPGHMIHAYRTALGGDLLAGWWGHWSVLAEWMEQPPAEKVVAAEAPGSDQDSGLFPLGLVTVPESMKAGARWLFDRAYGLEGNKTFGILCAYHAGYLLMNYPFDKPPQPPATSLPWIAPDPTGGHWVFRKPWQGAADSLLVLNLRSDVQGGCHYEASGRTWDMQLFALGRQWVGDKVLSDRATSAGSALPTVGNLAVLSGQRLAGAGGYAVPTVGDPGGHNWLLGPKTKAWIADADGKASLSLDMTPVFMEQLPKGGTVRAGLKTAKFDRFGPFIDRGIEASRYVAVDLSGACGAPVLLAVIDQTRGAKGLTWNMKLAKEAGAAKVEGNTVTVGDPAGANLKCTFIAPKALTLTGEIKATGADEYFVVITVQNGQAPAVKVEGEGLSAKVTIGGKPVSFDGAKIVLEK
jgi:hypothetical protein